MITWIYGAARTGKTTLANGFDKPLILNTNGSIKYIDAPAIHITDRSTLEQAVSELEAKDNDFETLIFDLIEDMRNISGRRVIARLTALDYNHIVFISEKQPTGFKKRNIDHIIKCSVSGDVFRRECIR